VLIPIIDIRASMLNKTTLSAICALVHIATRESNAVFSPRILAASTNRLPVWRRSGPREFAVEDLVAEGPGTLAPAPAHASRGQGARTKDGWAVVILRPLPDRLSPRQRSQIAFAAWEGPAKETGARRMRTGSIPPAVRGGQWSLPL